MILPNVDLTFMLPQTAESSSDLHWREADRTVNLRAATVVMEAGQRTRAMKGG